MKPLLLGLIGFLAGTLPSSGWSGNLRVEETVPLNEGIEILGTHYSAKLRELYKQVIAAYHRPIRFIPMSGHVDNSIEVVPSEILIRLKPGSTEDNVAHEFMHGIVQAAGFPQMFSVGNVQLANSMRSFAASDFDHLIINDRLQQLGYDPRRGFLSKADSYDHVLTLRPGDTPDAQTILVIGLLHELIRFHYYIGNSQAQAAIQKKFPEVRPYWARLSPAIAALPRTPKPQDMWKIVTVYIQIVDQVAFDRGASFKPSNLIGFNPVPLTENQLRQPARQIFEETIENLADNTLMLRSFLTSGKVLVGAHIGRREAAESLASDLALPAEEFARRRNIAILDLRPSAPKHE